MRPICLEPDCEVYLCPTSGEWECPKHSGFDTCCDDPACPSNRTAKWVDLIGIDPDYTGGLSVEEFIAKNRGEA